MQKISEYNFDSSSLPKHIQDQIASFNKLIMDFFEEKFSHHKGYKEFIEKIKEIYSKIEYQKEEIANGGASISSEIINRKEKYVFKINPLILDISSPEEWIAGIYFQAFFRLIASTVEEKTDRIEKMAESRIGIGMADLFSDAVADNYNKSSANKDILQNKKTSYFVPSSIVRNACITGNIADYIWYYLTDIDKFFEIYKERFGEKFANGIFTTNMFSGEFNFLFEGERKHIKNAIKKMDISQFQPLCLIQNNIANDVICEKIEELGLTEDQAKKAYPNLPNSFFEEHKYVFSSMNRKRLEIINKEIDAKELDEIADYFSNEIVGSSKTSKQNLASIINILHKTRANQRISKLDDQIMIPLLYAYYLKYNNYEFNAKTFRQALISLGVEEETLSDRLDIITLKAKKLFEIFKNLSLEEAYQKMKNIVSSEIRNNIVQQSLENQLENGKITTNDYLDQIIYNFKKTKSETYTPLILINSYIKKCVAQDSKAKELNVENFDIIKNKLEQILEKLGIESEIDLVSAILTSWDLKEESLTGALEIIATYGLKRMNTSETYEMIKLQGLNELINANPDELNEKVLRCVNSLASENYEKSISFHKKGGAWKCQNTRSIIILYALIGNQIREMAKNNEIGDEKQDNYRNLIIFCANFLSNGIKEEDKEVLTEIFGAEKVESQSYLSIFCEDEFKIEIYNKLKKQPFLAMMYHAAFFPKQTFESDIVNLYTIINETPKEATDFLKNEYKLKIQEIIKKIVEKGYDTTEITPQPSDPYYEFEILKMNLSAFANEQTVKLLKIRIIEACSAKIYSILGTKTEKEQVNQELLEKIRKNIEEVINVTEDELIKTELQKMLDNLSIYSFEGATK